VCAEHGAAALKILQSARFDLVLMDCHMPEMDGFECTARIREMEAEDPRQTHIPVVALTAAAMQGDREQCLAVGMDDYLTKPLDPDLLIRAVEKWLGAPAAHSPAPLPSPSSRADAPPVDMDKLLRLCGGQPEFVLHVLDKFEEQAARDSDAIESAARQAALAEIGELAHRLKGSSATLFIEGVRSEAACIEEMARRGNLAAAAEAAPRLRWELERARAHIAEWRCSVPASEAAARNQPPVSVASA
jgi:CheY-like chemotaxis protein/HPt (histidine-containing phosphotransfer) domain-containing protein